MVPFDGGNSGGAGRARTDDYQIMSKTGRQLTGYDFQRKAPVLRRFHACGPCHNTSRKRVLLDTFPSAALASSFDFKSGNEFDFEYKSTPAGKRVLYAFRRRGLRFVRR